MVDLIDQLSDTSPEVVISELVKPNSPYRESFYQRRLDGYVQKEHLLKLINGFHREVAFTEERGQLILTTVSYTPRYLGEEYDGPQVSGFNSSIMAHTHPNIYDTVFDFIGTADITTVYPGHHRNISYFMFSATNLIQYQVPTTHPLTSKPLAFYDYHTMFADYEKHLQMNIFFNTVSEYPHILDVTTLSERTAISKELAYKSGMIVAEATWDDVDNAKKILDRFNLRAQD
jgi:hypothetical protein